MCGSDKYRTLDYENEKLEKLRGRGRERKRKIKVALMNNEQAITSMLLYSLKQTTAKF